MTLSHGTDTGDIERRLTEEFPPSWIPEQIGDSLAGVVVRYTTGATAYGTSPIVVLRTANGERSVWLLSAVMRSKFSELKPAPGEAVGIRYLGERTSASGHDYKDFRIVVDRPDVAPDFDAWASEVEP